MSRNEPSRFPDLELGRASGKVHGVGTATARVIEIVADRHQRVPNCDQLIIASAEIRRHTLADGQRTIGDEIHCVVAVSSSDNNVAADHPTLQIDLIGSIAERQGQIPADMHTVRNRKGVVAPATLEIEIVADPRGRIQGDASRSASAERSQVSQRNVGAEVKRVVRGGSALTTSAETGLFVELSNTTPPSDTWIKLGMASAVRETLIASPVAAVTVSIPAE